MMVNALLGTILWGTYAEAFSILEPHMEHHPILTAGLSGGVAGGVQAVLAAPAENVRILLEGGSGGSSWLNAWKEVFQGTRFKSLSRKSDIEDIRQLRSWMKDVGDMAGRGWNGWGWGFGKDICENLTIDQPLANSYKGFAVFFAIFEVTRRVALQVKDVFQKRAQNLDARETGGVQRQLPRVMHGLTLVGGGVLAGLAYETASRPWDVARRTVQLHKANLQQTSVFHEGLKSWSCCNDVNKPVLDFDEFIKLPGCNEADCHSDEALKAEAPKAPSTTSFSISESGSGKETYSSATANLPVPASMSFAPATPAPVVVVEEDDLSVPVAPGTLCRRNGCKVEFLSDAVNRQGDGEGTLCTYHPSPPFFREGSKVKFTIYLPGPKRFSRTLDLFGPIDPNQSSYQVFGTKVELHLRKRDGRSWTLLEKTTQDMGKISLTFGVGGKTGTIGAKEVVLDDINKARESTQ
ncbi:hypothetical protein C0991_009740 [Blastosporella zonata]|nr:hypothetical protein C0991_009740 [Blastosporella zonata]